MQQVNQRTRCFGCFRPRDLCFCDAIPSIRNRTDILILQHRRERFHAFNTARIVDRSLQRCRLLVDHTQRLASQFESTTLADNVGLLFPSPEATLISDLPVDQRPDQLIILDGTWSQARSLVRDVPGLRSLPRVRLAPSQPGRYRIRREPDAHSLSTLEATVAALQVLEPDTDGLDRLLQVFDQMIDSQIDRSRDRWRRNLRRRRGASNLPRCLSGSLSDVVVAYGEHGPLDDAVDSARLPLYWAAERLDDGASFRCAIHAGRPLDNAFLSRMKLGSGDLSGAVSPEGFRERWRKFLGDDDQLVMFHPSMQTLLRRVAADFVAPTILKSVRIDDAYKRGTLDDVVRSLGLTTSPRDHTRASDRLASAIALVRFLNESEQIRAASTEIDDRFLGDDGDGNVDLEASGEFRDA